MVSGRFCIYYKVYKNKQINCQCEIFIFIKFAENKLTTINYQWQKYAFLIKLKKMNE